MYMRDTPFAEVADVVDVFCKRRHSSVARPNFILKVASAGKPVNIKKGQFLSPWEMQNVVDKAKSTGNEDIMVCERGFSFGYNNLVSDMRSLAVLRSTGCPVVFDATHSVQLPGGEGSVVRWSAGIHPGPGACGNRGRHRGLFMETHPGSGNGAERRAKRLASGQDVCAARDVAVDRCQCEKGRLPGSGIRPRGLITHD